MHFLFEVFMAVTISQYVCAYVCVYYAYEFIRSFVYVYSYHGEYSREHHAADTRGRGQSISCSHARETLAYKLRSLFEIVIHSAVF